MSAPPVMVGCALMSRTNSLAAGGWASFGGSEPFRFSGVDALQSHGHLWVISTQEQSFLTEGGARYPFLRHADFLPTPLTAIAEEVAPYDPNNYALAVQRVSEVLGRVMSMADQFSPVSDALARSGGVGRSLTSALQTTVAPTLRSEAMDAELLSALPSLLKKASPLGSPSGNDISVRIPANRIALADSVLSMLVPGSTWTEVPVGSVPNALSWAIGGNKPIVAKVCIRGALPRVKSSAPLMKHITRGAVRWMALPEIVALSKIVDMAAEKVLLADEMVPTSASLKVPRPIFAPAAAASISANLFAEAYMHAVSMPSLAADDAADEGRGQPCSVRAVWMTAAARALMMQEALKLSEQGFSVIEFGRSYLRVSLQRRELRNLRRAVAQSSLLSYPTGLRSREEPLVQAVRDSHEIGEEA